jgi:hypothetical protein
MIGKWEQLYNNSMTKEQMDGRLKMLSQWLVRGLVNGTINHIDQVTDAALDLRLVDIDSNDNLVATTRDDEEGFGDD